MKLLLDTHILLWSLLEPEQLRYNLIRELENPANQLWLSPISLWEIMILVEKGRVVLTTEPARWIRSLFDKFPFYEAPINREVAIQSRTVKLSHQDPADRFLAATAMVYDLTLVTADTRLLKADGFAVLPNA